MLGFTFENIVSFPGLFPGFAFDAPPGSFGDCLILFQTGNFSLREIRCGFQHDKRRTFKPPSIRGFAHAPVPGLLLQAFSPWLLVDRFHAEPTPASPAAHAWPDLML